MGNIVLNRQAANQPTKLSKQAVLIVEGRLWERCVIEVGCAGISQSSISVCTYVCASAVFGILIRFFEESFKDWSLAQK
ncbi:unnamed protein product [Enterobius vermicularis]|uniref:Pectin lyase-like superfamily protein n=1 Tax=Enterobius vermicularis TaxID=51028 RepID=A0A0N4V1J2_ENTVE|nr:unnamed protein product [Enterobius vermicularis]